jgi:hypothetical protein
MSQGGDPGSGSGGNREEEAEKIKRLEELVQSQGRQITEIISVIRTQTMTQPQSPVAPLVPHEVATSRAEIIAGQGVTPIPSPTAATEDPSLRMSKLRKEFMRCKPKSFSGGANLQKAEKWIRNMEKIHKTTQLDEEAKVTLSAFMLEGDADVWWHSILDVHKDVSTWQQFKDLFYEKYYPKAVIDRKREEFLHLRQNNMTVMEYEVQFTHLVQFSGGWITNEREKATRFIFGLKPKIRQAVASSGAHMYRDAVERALGFELAEQFDTPAMTTQLAQQPQQSSDKGSFSSQKRKFKGRWFRQKIEVVHLPVELL